jgi:TRAP transporter TAXI family solute receptor
MMRALRLALLALRDMAVTAGPVVLLVLALMWGAYKWLDPNPPQRVVLATGPAQSAYDEFGKRYARALAEVGIELVLLPSQGSADNLELIRSGKADMGFVQGGTLDLTPDDHDQLVSLGSLFVEPLWVFYREAAARANTRQAQLAQLTQLRGWRVNVGSDGSGVPKLFGSVLEANRLSSKDLVLSNLEQTPATVALLAGKVDALVFASAPESPLVQMLLQTPGIRLLDFAQSEAYARRLSYLKPVVLPQGVVDLAHNVPSRNVRLIAPTTGLLASVDTHPAVLQLMARTAVRLHGEPSWFSHARDYPSLANAELPLAQEAERALASGPTFLQRRLPFWLANLIERMWLAMGLIVALALPLSRIVPPLYTLRVRSRVFRWYADLRRIEQQVDTATPIDAPQREQLLAELNTLDERTSHIEVPLAYAEELYALRGHIHLVRKKLLRVGA